MTDGKLNPGAIRADMEAGTPGPWRAARPDSANGWWVIFTDADDVGTVDESGDGGFEEVTARRIARLPDLEQGYLDKVDENAALRARAEAAEALRREVNDVAQTMEQLAARSSRLRDTLAPLAKRLRAPLDKKEGGE